MENNKTIELNNLVVEYIKLQEQLEQLNEQKTLLGDNIKNLLKENNLKEFVTLDNQKIQIINSTRFTYCDEIGIVNYLISKGLRNKYIIESIDNKKLNAELKKEASLYEDLKNYVEKKDSESLKVTK